MPTVDDLYAVQEELLGAVVASLEVIPTHVPSLLGAPARQLVAPPGQVALDCEQVVVHASTVSEAATRPVSPTGAADKRHVFGRISMPALGVLVVRDCVPIGRVDGTRFTPPTVDQLQTAARQINADGWALWNGVFSRVVNGTLLERCTQVSWESMAPVGPAGAFAGWSLTLRVRLPGYLEEAGS